MALRKAAIVPVEVDMVPLIDIVSLLLMFLVMVGDMARAATNVKMTLPRADMAVADDKLATTEGRIVVQIKMGKDGRYCARVENNDFELVGGGANKALITFLEEQITRRKAKDAFTLGPNGEVPFPVKLRIPAEAPMAEVERVIMTMAQAKLVNVQYAALGKNDK
ncbi:MAG: biopolymer transporter ExbD [Planctomycetota bacterium]